MMPNNSYPIIASISQVSIQSDHSSYLRFPPAPILVLLVGDSLDLGNPHDRLLALLSPPQLPAVQVLEKEANQSKWDQDLESMRKVLLVGVLYLGITLQLEQILSCLWRSQLILQLIRLVNVQGVPKKRTFRMLLEPQCTGLITSSRHPLCLGINFLSLLRLSHVQGKI